MNKGRVIKRDGVITNRRELAQFFMDLGDDGVWQLTAKNAKRRSTNQNDFYWLLLTEYIQPALYDAGWERVKTKDDAHKFVTNLFLKQVEVNEKTGEEMPIVLSTTELSTTEWEIFREEINMWAAEYLNITLPDPGQQMNLYDNQSERRNIRKVEQGKAATDR